MEMWLASILIFLTATIFLFIGLRFGSAFQRGKQDDTWMEYAYENAQLLHENDALREELTERKAKEAPCQSGQSR